MAEVSPYRLHDAALRGDVDEIRDLLLNQGYRVNDLDATGNTPLLAAFSNCAENRLPTVQTLVSFNADVNALTSSDSQGTPFSALQLCCMWKPPDFLEVTTFLMDANANVNVLSYPRLRNLVHMAAIRLNASEYHNYLTLMANDYRHLLCEPDHVGNTPLHMATRLELSMETLKLYSICGADFNYLNVNEETPTDLAVINNRSADFLRHLHEFGAYSKANVPLDHLNTSRTLTWVEVQWKQKFIGVAEQIDQNPGKKQVLINELEAEWNAAKLSNSLLHAAAINRNMKMAKILLEMGFKVNHAGRTGYTPLQLCLENNQDEALPMINLLLEYGADVDQRKVYKHACFHVCLSRKPIDWKETFYVLLQRTCDPDGALEVAKRNSPVEFIALEEYITMKNEGNASNNGANTHQSADVLELVTQFENSTTSPDEIDTEVVSQCPSTSALATNLDSFKCFRCQEEFESSLKLQLHTMKKHNGVNFFRCHVCSQMEIETRIKTRQGYEIHLRTHTKEKPLLCHQCGKCYQAHSGLDKHFKANHSGERPYACTECIKTFALPNSLKEHLKIHMEKTYPFGCDVAGCKKRYQHKKGLTRHKQSHDTGNKFSCQVCNQVFNRKDNLDRHFTKVHGVKK